MMYLYDHEERIKKKKNTDRNFIYYIKTNNYKYASERILTRLNKRTFLSRLDYEASI